VSRLKHLIWLSAALVIVSVLGTVWIFRDIIVDWVTMPGTFPLSRSSDVSPDTDAGDQFSDYLCRNLRDSGAPINADETLPVYGYEVVAYRMRFKGKDLAPSGNLLPQYLTAVQDITDVDIELIMRRSAEVTRSISDKENLTPLTRIIVYSRMAGRHVNGSSGELSRATRFLLKSPWRDGMSALGEVPSYNLGVTDLLGQASIFCEQCAAHLEEGLPPFWEAVRLLEKGTGGKIEVVAARTSPDTSGSLRGPAPGALKAVEMLVKVRYSQADAPKDSAMQNNAVMLIIWHWNLTKNKKEAAELTHGATLRLHGTWNDGRGEVDQRDSVRLH